MKTRYQRAIDFVQSRKPKPTELLKDLLIYRFGLGDFYDYQNLKTKIDPFHELVNAMTFLASEESDSVDGNITIEYRLPFDDGSIVVTVFRRFINVYIIKDLSTEIFADEHIYKKLKKR